MVCIILGLTGFGQACVSVSEALQQLHAASDKGVILEREIRKNCPAAADSLSLLFHKRSVYAYNSEGDYDLAIEFALRALREQRQLYGTVPQEPLGKTLANLGLFYRVNGQYTMALPYLREADAIFRQLGLFKRQNYNQQQLVKLWHATGDYGRSDELLHLMLAEAVAEESAAKFSAEAETRRLLGEQANQTENYAAGLPEFALAADIFKALGDIKTQLMSYMGQGRSLYYLGDYDEARQVTEKALALAGEYELDYDKAVMYNLLALIAKELGEFDRARRMVEQGEKYALTDGNPRLQSLLYNTSAEIAAGDNDFPRAVVLNRQAIKVLVETWEYSEETPFPTSAQTTLNEYHLDLFQRLASQAGFLQQAGEIDEALAAVRRADQIADLLRADFNGQVSKLFWRKEAVPVYERGIELSHQKGDPEGVFYFLEKSRSVLLLEALLMADAREGIDPVLSDRLAKTERKLQLSRQKLRLEDDCATESDRQEVALLRDSLQEIKEEISVRYPAIRQLLLKPELVDLEKARANLARGGWDRQLHFFLGTERAYVFSLTPQQAELTDLGATRDLSRNIYAILAFFSSPVSIDQSPQDFLLASETLYKKLLQPLNLEKGEQLLIIPDGLLAYLPFAALVTQSGATNLSSAPYLIRQNIVSYAQSATVLDWQSRPGVLAAAAATAFSPFATSLPGNPAAALPFSELEVAGLSKNYATDVLEGLAANREALLATAPNYSIVHLSTHAWATRDSLEPARILTATDPVYLSDIYETTLRAELVTLSACHSNIGPLARGEGVLGLGRAFTAAGARGVVASLWALNDRATAEVITGFYDQLAAGSSKPLALHAAQLAYLNRTDIPAYLKSPYYWAGLTYYGNAAGLSAGGFPWKWLLALGVPLLFLAGWWWRRGKSIDRA